MDTVPDMQELPEERQSKAVRALMDLVDQRAELQRQLDQINETIRDSSLAANSAGVAASRVIGIIGVSPRTFYKWKSEQDTSGRRSTARKKPKS